MYFKLEHVLNKLIIGFREQEPLTFSYGKKQKTLVTIRLATAKEKEKYKNDILMCTAVTEVEPSSKVRTVFEKLGNDQMPECFKKPRKKNGQSHKDEFEYIDSKGRITGKRIPPLSLFPEYFQEFKSYVHHGLSEFIKRTVRITRWRNAIKSSHNPILFTLGLSWSFDNKQWHGMPSGSYNIVGGEISIYMPVFDEIRNEIEKLVADNVNEPLGHELFLEAWDQKTTNPRSALILGIVAAEVGFKQCVGKLVPDAEWLANTVPSPPLRKMLTEYLPLLPVKLRIQGKVLRPPKRVLTALSKGVETRNQTSTCRE